MSNVCFECDSDMIQVRRTEPVTVRGEKIEVEFEYLQCPNCGEEYEVSRPDNDPLDRAYRIYRERKGLLQPEDIRGFREDLQLPQREMSAILGIGVATLNRYENGALQTEALDKAIRYYREDPRRILARLKEQPGLVKKKTADVLASRIPRIRSKTENWFDLFCASFTARPPSILNGYKKFDLEVLRQMISFYCYLLNGVSKTKLMKLLFYADFSYFREFGRSISGAYYMHDRFGPVVDCFEIFLGYLSRPGSELYTEEVFWELGSFEIYKTNLTDFSALSESEIRTLQAISRKFRRTNAEQLSNLSHDEQGYDKTERWEFIPYSYALDLIGV